MIYNKDNPLRVFEAFGGYGSQSLALKRLKRDFPDFDYKVVGYSDIEPAAIKAYMALHDGEEIVNYGDITKIDWSQVPDFDLFTYSFPCQDISSAGKQRGFSKGVDTRSGLLWYCELAIEAKHPRYLLMENVAALVHSKFVNDYFMWLETLERIGYENFTKVLNSKDYGVPQNRERTFCVGILREVEQPKFNWPSPFKLELRLKDVLEDEVDERYYLSDERIQNLLAENNNEESEEVVVEGRLNSSQDGVVVNPNGISKCHTAGNRNCPKIVQ